MLAHALLVISSCNKINSPLNETPIAPPSASLPYQQIMKLQGISSLHYVLCDSVVVNGVPKDSSLVPIDEYYVDSMHVKLIQYYFDNHYWNVTVYDLRKNIVWNYYSGKVTYPQLPNWPVAFEQSVQSCLGSNLRSSPVFLRTEYVDTRLCNVFTDSTGLQEWVWPEHLLPIQQRGFGSQRSIYQISTTRKIIIDINVPFADSIFEPRS